MTLTRISFDIVRRLESSAVKTAAYLACTRYDDELGSYDFSRKSHELFETAVLLPPGSPSLYLDPAQLWTAAEKAERQANGQSARQVLISIPRNLPEELWPDFVKEIARPWVADGMALQYGIHCPLAADSKKNGHIHFQLSMRRMTDAGFAKTKAREWNTQFREGNGKAERQRICDRANQFFARHGLNIKLDPRTLEEQGIDRPPEPDAPRADWQSWKRQGSMPELAPASVKAVLQHRELRTRLAKVEQYAVLAEKSAAEIEKEIRHQSTEREENKMARTTQRKTVRPASWMRMSSGYEGLSDSDRQKAERTYQAWAKENEAAARKHSIEDYVSYVQQRRAEEERAASEQEAEESDIEREIAHEAEREKESPSISSSSSIQAEASRIELAESLLALRYPQAASIRDIVRRYEPLRDDKVARLYTKSGGRILDSGDGIRAESDITPELAHEMIRLAAAKGWTEVRISGDEKFQHALSRAAMLHVPPIANNVPLPTKVQADISDAIARRELKKIGEPKINPDADLLTVARARLEHQERLMAAKLAGKPSGNTSAESIATGRILELIERRERAQSDAREAIQAASQHRAEHGLLSRLMDSSVRARQALLDRDARRLDREARRLDRSHEGRERQIEREALRQAKANQSALDDWRYRPETRKSLAEQETLRRVRGMLERGDPRAISALASGDVNRVLDPDFGREPKEIAVKKLLEAEQAMKKNPERLKAAQMATAAAVNGDEATIAAGAAGDIAEAMQAAQAWQRERDQQAERQRQEQTRLDREQDAKREQENQLSYQPG